MSMVVCWIRILQSKPSTSRILRIGHPTIAVLPLRLLNLLTNAPRCLLAILTFCVSFGQLVYIHTMILHHLQITQTFAKQLMQHQLGAFLGRASLSLTTGSSLTMLHLGWRQCTLFGIEILACFSRTCLRILNLPATLTTHYLEDMIPMVIVYMKILCQVIGHGRK